MRRQQILKLHRTCRGRLQQLLLLLRVRSLLQLLLLTLLQLLSWLQKKTKDEPLKIIRKQ